MISIYSRFYFSLANNLEFSISESAYLFLVAKNRISVSISVILSVEPGMWHGLCQRIYCHNSDDRTLDWCSHIWPGENRFLLKCHYDKNNTQREVKSYAQSWRTRSFDKNLEDFNAFKNMKSCIQGRHYRELSKWYCPDNIVRWCFLHLI